MSHLVKCLYCGERFDRDWVPNRKITQNRYAHLECIEQNKNKDEKEGVEENMSRVPNKNSASKEVPPSIDLLKSIQDSILSLVASASIDDILEEVLPTIEERIISTYGYLPEVHEIKTETEVRTIKGTTHEKFDEVLKIVGLNIPVYLTGKAGTGKNVICKQVAEALGLEFYFTNAVTQEYKLTGFIDAGGTYHETQFYKAFTQGGLFFLDEIDGSIPEVLIILNAAIANRYFDFPIGKMDAHPNFRVVAAGNTIGTGADNNYTGRYCLDRSSLDRFAMIPIDYSPKIENEITNGKKELIDFCHAFRKSAEKAGVECLFSYRALEYITKLETVIMDLKEVLNMALLKGLDKDDINILVQNIKKESEMKTNCYVNSMEGLIKENENKRRDI